MTAIGVFEGVRVLEIGQYVAAPYAAELLSHGGAEVVKVEPLAGDATRYNTPVGPDEGRQYIVKARGKLGIPIDLGSDVGKNIASELAAASDVLITNMRPGAATRLGLDFETLSGSNPRLVYGEITGFGDDGPLASRPSVDMIAQSWSGLNMSVGAARDGFPSHHEAFLCDYTAGVLLAFAIAAALRQVALGNPGQRVSTSLAHAALVLQHRTANHFEGIDDWKTEIDNLVHTEGLSAARDLRERLAADQPFFFNSYPTSDGVVGIGAVGTMAAQLCDEFGVSDPRTEPEWKQKGNRRRLFDEARAALARALATLTSDEIVDRLVARGIPAAPFRFVEQAMFDPDARAAGLIHEWQHPTLGKIVMPAAPVSFSGSHYEAAGATPALGEHTDEILRRLGYDEITIDRLVADGIVWRNTSSGPSEA
ncbi:MAG: hypothetical protein GY708_17075 [Actinomycetia bacterium]|nr:hypothetical protein [Actinomycetes bacterium]